MVHLNVTNQALIISSLGILYYTLQTIRSTIRRRRLIKEHNCQPVAHTVGQWPLGLDILMEEKRANDQNNLPTVMNDRFKKFGNTHGINGLRRMKYFTCEPKIIQTIVATKFESFPKRPLVIAAKGLLGHENIFMIDGAKWSHARAQFKPQFVRDQVGDFADLEKHVVKFLARADPAANKAKGRPEDIDIQALVFDLVFDSSTENLLGESADTQTRKEAGLAGDAIDFSDAFDVATHVAAIRVGIGAFFSWVFLGWKVNMGYVKACNICTAYVTPYVDRALARYSQNRDTAIIEAEEDKATGARKKYVALNEFAADGHETRASLISHAMGFLLAGRDTTSAMLSWTLYLLARHPQAYAKLRKEIVEAFTDEDGTMRVPEYEKLKSLPYLRYVLKESLRLFPVVPVNERVAAEDVVLPVGGGPDGQSPLLLKAGEGMAWSLFSMHRRKDLYGDDAEEFNPDRWAKKSMNSIGWGYLPFHGGPRICMGQQRSLNEGSYILTRFVQTFSAVELPRDWDVENDRPQFKMGITTNSAVGVKVRLRRAE